MEILRYICARQVHELEALVPQAGHIAVVQVVCVHLRVPLALRGVQYVVDAHASQKRLIFRRNSA